MVVVLLMPMVVLQVKVQIVDLQKYILLVAVLVDTEQQRLVVKQVVQVVEVQQVVKV